MSPVVHICWLPYSVEMEWNHLEILSNSVSDKSNIYFIHLIYQSYFLTNRPFHGSKVERLLKENEIKKNGKTNAKCWGFLWKRHRKHIMHTAKQDYQIAKKRAAN